MKKIILTLSVLLAITSANAQSPKHIKWTVAGKKINATTAEIYFKATLDPHWHIWSQTPGDDMLIPPTFTFDDKAVKAVGMAKELGKKVQKTEEGFKGKLTFYEGSVVFVQKIQLGKSSDLKGIINYQICDEKSCLPPTDFAFTVKLK
jgi:hypothetical protein